MSKDKSKDNEINNSGKEAAEDISAEVSVEKKETDASEEAMDKVADEVISLIKKDEKKDDKKNGKESEEKPEEVKNKDSKKNDRKGQGGKNISKEKTDRQIAAENAKFRKLSFTEKCKRDPIIPVSLLLALVAILIAGIYFILPNTLYPSMGMTPDAFKKSFNSSEIANYLVSSENYIGFSDIPYVDPTVTPDILGDKAVVKGSLGYVDFFAGEAPMYSYSGIQGAARKNDGKLAYVRIYTLYDEDPVSMYLANTLQTLYPELSIQEAINLALKIMHNYEAGSTKYDVRGNYAIRLVPVSKDDIPYIVIDVVPKAALRSSQIRYKIDEMTIPSDSGNEPQNSENT